MLIITVVTGEIHISEASEFAPDQKTPLMTLFMGDHVDVLVEVGSASGYQIDKSTDSRSVLIS